MVCYDSPDIHRFAPDLSNFTSLNFGVIVDAFTVFESQQEWSLANGSMVNVSGRTSYFDKATSPFRGYLLEYYAVGGTVIDWYESWPVEAFLAV